MDTLRYYGDLARYFLRINLKRSISYYGKSFIWAYLAHVVGYIGSYITIWGAMRSFDGLGGWSIREVVFLYSIDLLTYALAQMFVQSFWNMDELVRKGKLDDYLLRPIHSLFYIVLYHIEYGYIAHISVAACALVITLVTLPIAWSFVAVVSFIVAIIGGCLIQFVLGVLPSCMSFWTVESNNFQGIFRWTSRSFIQYPIIIYPVALRFAISFIVPVAFINYYPYLSMLDKEQGIWIYGPLLALGIGAVLAFVTVKVWDVCVRRYSSSG